ncbi:MAG: hypothetical protein ACYCVB_06480 [Bacilli bacterium]
MEDIWHAASFARESSSHNLFHALISERVDSMQEAEHSPTTQIFDSTM